MCGLEDIGLLVVYGKRYDGRYEGGTYLGPSGHADPNQGTSSPILTSSQSHRGTRRNNTHNSIPRRERFISSVTVVRSYLPIRPFLEAGGSTVEYIKWKRLHNSIPMGNMITM